MKRYTALTKPEGTFYTLSISSGEIQYIIQSNTERAFIIALLQDAMRGSSTYRSIKQAPSSVELLAFSITRKRILLLLFSYTLPAIQTLGSHLINSLTEYQEDLEVHRPRNIQPVAHLSVLKDAHAAFMSSLNIHASHSDWEYDRYSSVGFYIHQRGGSWVHTWRMGAFYNNTPETYRQLLQESVKNKARIGSS